MTRLIEKKCAVKKELHKTPPAHVGQMKYIYITRKLGDMGTIKRGYVEVMYHLLVCDNALEDCAGNHP